MGLYTEETYRIYGPQWKENLFYSHLLSIPLFLPFLPSLIKQFMKLANSAPLALPLTTLEDYPNLSLEAELRSLCEWAGRPENAKGWFHAVQGGLAKRNRESALAVERVKAEATARAHAPPAREPSAYFP